MVGQPREQVSQPGEWLHPVRFRTADQRVEQRSVVTTSLVSNKEKILAPDRWVFDELVTKPSLFSLFMIDFSRPGWAFDLGAGSARQEVATIHWVDVLQFS